MIFIYKEVNDMYTECGKKLRSFKPKRYPKKRSDQESALFGSDRPWPPSSLECSGASFGGLSVHRHELLMGSKSAQTSVRSLSSCLANSTTLCLNQAEALPAEQYESSGP